LKKGIQVGKSKENPRQQENIRKYGNQDVVPIKKIELGKLGGDVVTEKQ